MAWIRQKPEQEDSAPPKTTAETPHSAAHSAPRRESKKMEKIVNIGQSVQIKGELKGNEDLTIEGQVDGKILVKDHNLTIGANGRITAEVHAKTVVVVGEVIGNVTADDKIELAPSGSVQGDLRAPRVAIADGARFKGSIDMERKGGSAPAATSPTPKPTASQPMVSGASMAKS